MPYQKLLNTFHDPIVLGLFQKQLQTQIKKHKLKYVVLILLSEVLKFEKGLVELLVEVAEFERHLLGVSGSGVVLQKLLGELLVNGGFLGGEELVWE